MKEGTALILVITFLLLSVQIVDAQEIEVESRVLNVSENELVELSAQQKFDDLIIIMKELVKQNIKEKVKLKEILINDFNLLPEQGYKINYQLLNN